MIQNRVVVMASPGFSKKTGYHMRVMRDVALLSELHMDVRLVVLNGMFSYHENGMKLSIVQMARLWRSSSFIWCENIGSTFVARLLAIILGIKSKRLVLVMHGSLTELAHDKLGFMKYILYKGLLRHCFSNYHCVLCVSEYMKNSFTHEDPKSKLLFSPNLPSEEYIRHSNLAKSFSKNDLRKELKIETSKTIILYSGNTQPWQKIDLLADLMEVDAATENRFHFVILTNEIIKFSQLLSSRSIAYDGFTLRSVGNLEVPRYLRASDFLYCLRDDNEINKFSCPTKAVEYLYSGSPMLVSAGLGDFADIVTISKCGGVIDIEALETPRQIYDRVVNVIDNFSLTSNQQFSAYMEILLQGDYSREYAINVTKEALR